MRSLYGFPAASARWLTSHDGDTTDRLHPTALEIVVAAIERLPDRGHLFQVPGKRRVLTIAGDAGSELTSVAVAPPDQRAVSSADDQMAAVAPDLDLDRIADPGSMNVCAFAIGGTSLSIHSRIRCPTNRDDDWPALANERSE